jgi:hypothetical protein
MKKAKAKTKAKTKPVIQKSKTKNFLKRIRENSMVDYFTKLRILNPAAQLMTDSNEPRREGGFVRLAHARDEFTAPIITKGKSVQGSTKPKAKPKTKAKRKVNTKRAKPSRKPAKKASRGRK